jgi:tetratricopeptide (TPR) repeat protein
MHTGRKIRWTNLVAVLVSAVAGADAQNGAHVGNESSESPEFDWSELMQAPPASANQQQRDEFAAYAEALANEAFSEAEIAAKQMVEHVDADAADAVVARARALHNLAIAQQYKGSHASAMQNYSTALELTASEDDRLSPSLILPLRGLASAYLETGRPDDALATYERALHVSNVNYGPHSFRQVPVLQSQMQFYLDLEDPASALTVLERITMLYAREYAWNSAEMLPALYQEAELYDQLDMYESARKTWRHILNIQKEHLAENDLALIEPNIRIAKYYVRILHGDSFRYVASSPAEKHLEQALWIAENSPGSNWEVRKDCLLSLADFYTVFDLKGRARRYYTAAWELLSSADEYLAARAENLEQPVPLLQPQPDPYANFEYRSDRDSVAPEDYLVGEVLMAFTVTDEGRTTDHRFVEANPPGFAHMERRVRNAVKGFVYRPRYEHGQAAETADQYYRARYYYLPSDYEASLAKSAGRVGPRRGKEQ